MTVEELFSEGGALATTLKFYEPRDGQIDLACAVEKALSDHEVLVAEAGTGIGKTFAYLLPALLHNKKVLVSTATKNLQDQLFFKDVPTVERILGRHVSSAMLKGRHNYLCKSKYQQLLSGNNQFTLNQLAWLEKIADWVDKTESGDLSEVLNLDSVDAGFLEQIANCEGRQGCEYFDECFLKKAREKASEAELVIANHALLMADIQLKETGYAEILPACNLIVIDEAHHLAKAAIQAFSESLGSNQLSLLANETKTLAKLELTDPDVVVSACDRLLDATYAFLSGLEALPIDTGRKDAEPRFAIEEIRYHDVLYTAFKALMQAYGDVLKECEKLANDIDAFAERHDMLAETGQRIKQIFTKSKPPDTPTSDVALDETDNDEQNDAENTQSDDATVGLLTWTENGWTATKMPITLGFRLRRIIEQYADSWVLTSATMSYNQQFDAFLAELGLPKDTPTLMVASPFPYEQHARVYLPNTLPNSDARDYIPKLIAHIKPTLTQLGGRAFLLFTSYRALNEAAAQLESDKFNLWIQGHAPKAQLIDQFIKTDNSLLLGTMSFWEGVDIRGANLSCVVIDKIPFPSPGDPIIKEQSDYFERLGYNAFSLCFLPKAATLLKQGAGRLIRSQTDKGLLILGDKRFTQKSYGGTLLAGLPIQRHVTAQNLEDFLAELSL